MFWPIFICFLLCFPLQHQDVRPTASGKATTEVSKLSCFHLGTTLGTSKTRWLRTSAPKQISHQGGKATSDASKIGSRRKWKHFPPCVLKAKSILSLLLLLSLYFPSTFLIFLLPLLCASTFLSVREESHRALSKGFCTSRRRPNARGLGSSPSCEVGYTTWVCP